MSTPNTIDFNFNEYQSLALRTLSGNGNSLKHAAYGIITEVGEIIDTYKRHEFYGVELDTKNLKEEIGDVLWYVAVGFNALEEYPSKITFEKTAQTEVENILKELTRKASNIMSFYKYDHDCIWVDLDEILHLLDSFAIHLGTTLKECADANVLKLQKRYPDKFTTERAVNRDVENELNHISS